MTAVLHTPGHTSAFTLILGGWAAVGPLVGILVGHFLTRSWQREQWNLDNRKDEYRELHSALTNAYMNMVQVMEKSPVTDEMDRAFEESKVQAFRVLRDRIFIAEEIERADLLTRWTTAVHNYEQSFDERKFADRFTEINQLVIRLALRRLPSQRNRN